MDPGTQVPRETPKAGNRVRKQFGNHRRGFLRAGKLSSEPVSLFGGRRDSRSFAYHSTPMVVAR